jgi:RHS repeat-associated protein
MKMVYFTFDGLDRLTVINRGEYDDQEGWNWAVLDSYAFDADSRMTGLTHIKGSTTLATYTWTYDQASRPSGFTSSLDGTAGYTYDSGGQLTVADYNYQTDEAYSYDANGNRTNTGYDTDPNNRLASDGVYNYQYDDEGNRTRRTRISDESVTEYTWDHRNRLTSVTERAGGVGTAATKVVEYKYDPDNRLVGKTLDPDGAGEEEASEEYYAYDQTPFSTRENASQMLFRFTGPTVDDLSNRYLWAPVVDLLLSDEKLTAPDEPGDIYWALGDNLNTVRDIARYNPSTDTTTIVNHRVYDAFGKLTSETNGAVDLIFGFTGRLFDDATGLQNNLHRWYDPTIGRWLSEDPIGFTAGDANLFRYVRNAPTTASDPSGLQGSGGSASGGVAEVLPPWIPFGPNYYAVLERKFLAWYEREKDDMGWLKEVPPPPDKLEFTRRQGFRPSPWAPGFAEAYVGLGVVLPEGYEWDSIASMQILGYHRHASYGIRSKTPTPNGHGQQAMYDAAGRLITGGLSAGTPDRVSPMKSPSGHYREDVEPFNWAWTLDVAYGRRRYRAMYLEVRPPNQGTNAPPNVVN